MTIPESKTHPERVAPHAAGKRVVLTIRGLRKSFGGQAVLDGANADLREGEVVLLRGDNGSGKTTLLNILTGNLEPDAGTIRLRPNGQEETFRFPRKWWESLNPFDHFTPERVASEAVGRTWQDVRLFPTLTLSDNIAVAKQRQSGENPWRALIPGLSSGKEEESNRLASSAMLTDLGLAGRDQSSGDRISLGQTKRVAIARAVQAGARILFLDEPLSGLDAAGIENVLGLLSSLARNARLTLIIVEHTFNIPRVLKFANSVWTLRDGHIRMQSPAEVHDEYSSDSYNGAIKLIAAQLGDRFQREETALYGGACLTRFIPKNPHAERSALLEVRNLLVRRGPRLVIGNESSSGQIEGLSFKLYQDDIAILQAPNGWGKTTLLDVVTGVIPLVQGELILKGCAIHDMPTWRRVQQGLSVLPSRNQLFGSLTVAEVGSLTGLRRAQAVDACRLDALVGRQVSSLSGGERQRVSLAATNSSVVGIYDEPFSALDRTNLEFGFFENKVTVHGCTLILLPYI